MKSKDKCDPPGVPPFGAYLVARRDGRHGTARWAAGELALVFSRPPRGGPPPAACDLLFENGRTVFGLPAARVAGDFDHVHTDPAVVLDGCSTNPGWAAARAAAGR